MNHRWSTNLIPFGSMSDRFCADGYRHAMSTRERILRAKEIEGLEGVELHYPSMFEEASPAETRALLDEVGLQCSLVSAAMSSDPTWALGSLTNPDQGIRRNAIERVKAAMDASLVLGAGQVNLWLGQDGFDYPFQADYRRLWHDLVEGVSECANYNSNVRLCVEPKPKEPRAHSLIGTVSRVLLLIHDVGFDNVGCLFDTGHAFIAQENLGEQVVLLQERGRLFHLHLNDNYGDWDWDMIVGSVHFVEFLEMMFWIQQTGYDRWFSLDQYPQRQDPTTALALSIRSVKHMEQLLSRMDGARLLGAVAGQDYVTVREAIESAMV